MGICYNLPSVLCFMLLNYFLQRTLCQQVQLNKAHNNLTQVRDESRKIVKGILEHMPRGIPADYNINSPPLPPDGNPVAVDIAVTVFDIRDITEISGEMTLEINFKMSWYDPRLQHMANNWNYAVLHPSLLQKMWHPDIYIDHVKKVDQPKLMSLPASLRVYNDSRIRYSARLAIGMSCQVDFRYYPADTQRCDIDMKSYAYMDDSLRLGWEQNKEAAIKKGLVLPNYDVGLGDTDYFTVTTSAGHYTGLRFTVILKRKLSFHVIQTYIPSALFVVISWLSFLVAPELTPGRMTLCMTTLLTLIAMFGAVRQNSPSVSYVKGLDIWMVVCIFFVFLTLLEYTAVLKMRALKSNPDKPSRFDPGKIAAHLETYGSKIIPLLFLIFVLAYWPWLLIASDYYNNDELFQTRYVMD